MNIDTPNMVAAMEAADPWLATIQRQPGDGPAMHLDRRLREDAARVKVRRVVAALSGFDIRRETSPDVDPGTLPAIINRDFVDALKTALCNENVFAAISNEIGEAAAGDLIGAVGML